ncbi:MAG: hypothetical protein IKZ96_03620 [Bacilli bacterium]|nr:hypothetical protein [Bacilli bacterium]
MKKILAGLLVLTMVVVLAGCGKKNVKPEEEKIKGNCTVFECIKNIEVTDSLETVNEKMGFDGKKKESKDSYTIYVWEVTKDSSIKVQFNEGGKSNITIEFDKEKIANNKVDLTNYEDIQNAIKKGEMTVSKFNEMVGNVEGTLVEKSAYSKKYLWYSASNNYLYGTFSTTTNKCTFITGRRAQ